MEKNYRGVIWTTHALQRLSQRGIKQGDAWATWKNPEQSRYAKAQGAWVYYKTYGNSRIEVVAKKNEKGEWTILSVWSKPVYGTQTRPKSKSLLGMVFHSSVQKVLSILHKKRVNLLSLLISTVCFTFVIFMVFSEIGGSLILSNLRSDSYRSLIVFAIVFGILTLFICFTFTKIKSLKIISGVFLLIVVIISILFFFIINVNRVVGESMLPNVADKDLVAKSLISYIFRLPQRGDVVVFGNPIFPEENLIGRIVGLPGEHISIHEGRVYINDKPLEELYLYPDELTASGSYISDKNILIASYSYVILQDRRQYGYDSRFFGFVNRGLMRGKAIYVFWPLTHIHSLMSHRFYQSGKNVSQPFDSCQTLNTKMVLGSDGKGEIGCDIEVKGTINLSQSYCEGQKTHTKKFLSPDAYRRPNRFFATLTGLDLNEEVKVFAYTNSGIKVECLPSLNY